MLLAYEPRWSPDSLIAFPPPPPVNPGDALLKIDEKRLLLHVAWSDIQRLERRNGNHAAQGCLIGLIVGTVIVSTIAMTANALRATPLSRRRNFIQNLRSPCRTSLPLAAADRC